MLPFSSSCFSELCVSMLIAVNVLSMLGPPFGGRREHLPGTIVTPNVTWTASARLPKPHGGSLNRDAHWWPNQRTTDRPNEPKNPRRHCSRIISVVYIRVPLNSERSHRIAEKKTPNSGIMRRYAVRRAQNCMRIVDVISCMYVRACLCVRHSCGSQSSRNRCSWNSITQICWTESGLAHHLYGSSVSVWGVLWVDTVLKVDSDVNWMCTVVVFPSGTPFVGQHVGSSPISTYTQRRRRCVECCVGRDDAKLLA